MKKVEWAEHVARIRITENAKFWSEGTEGKIPFGQNRRRWEDNVKMDLDEIWRGFGLDSSASLKVLDKVAYFRTLVLILV